ncbi:MAG: DNA-directed RNA polymerase subunit alpha C-terminal domain-containing protein [Elusimicrobiales bacterium]|nr:DNA-directed RNA polymerase subunit alpha C-terminal domain-containing protein [Elusimicrobiales bacterium]
MDSTALFDKLLQPTSAIILPRKAYGKLRAAGLSLIIDLVKTPDEKLALINGINNLIIYEIGVRLEELGIPRDVSFSYSKFYAYAEQKGIIFSDFLRNGHTFSNPDLIPQAKELQFKDIAAGSRAKRAIAQTKATKLGEVLALKTSDLYGIKNCGVATYLEIGSALEHFFASLLVRSDVKNIAETKDFVDAPPQISEDILPDGILSLKVTELPFSGRALNAFGRNKIKTVADLMARTENELLAIQNLGAATVKGILRITKGLKDPVLTGTITNPISNLEEALTLIKKTFDDAEFASGKVQSNRIRKILFARLAGKGKSKTLEELARDFGLTRERVRQLESRGLEVLEPHIGRACWLFLQAFVGNLIKSGGVLECNDSKDLLSGIEFHIFIEMTKKVSELVHFDFDETTWLAKDEEVLVSKLNRHFEKESENGEFLDENEIRNSISAFCSKNDLSKNWEDYLFRKTHKTRLRKARALYAVGAPKRGAIVEILVQKHFPTGISPTNAEDADKFLSVFKKSEFASTTQKPLGALRAALNDRERFILWDRGTYIARSTISINKHILKLAEERIDIRLDADLVCVSVYGVFEDIKPEAILSGIPNPCALYSCLRIWTKGKYRFFKYPYIYPRHTKKRIIGATKQTIESYMHDQSGALTTGAVADQLGLREYQVINAIQESLVVLKCANGKCVHINKLNIGASEKQILEMLLTDIKAKLDKYEHISVRQVYDDNRVFLTKIGIPDSTCLYSFLARRYNDLFDCPRLPYILKHDLLGKDAKVNAQALVEEYFNDKHGPVYIKDLVKHFSEERGYPSIWCYSLPFYCEGFFRYSLGAFISKTAISWNIEKQKQLKDIALGKYAQNCQLGRPYVNIEELLEKQLPEIDENKQGIYWQKKLLVDILEEIDGIEVLGSLESVYVCIPNKYSIESTDDLICHILKTEFSGAANKTEFTRRIVELGIAKNISGSSEKYTIENEEISLTKC